LVSSVAAAWAATIDSGSAQAAAARRHDDTFVQWCGGDGCGLICSDGSSHRLS
jgi:hypothetical protein